MTQDEKILSFMKENGSITPLEAMAEFGCMRLAARIADLRSQGIAITRKMERSRNRYGETVSFARYSLEE